MSIRSVNRQINKALTDKVLTQCEAEQIVKTAKKGRLTTGETKAIADLYADGQFMFPTHFPDGVQVMPRPPQYDMEAGARETLQSFFIAQKVPMGDAFKTAKTEIEFALKDFNYDSPLAEAPNTKHLHHVFLADRRPVDGNRTEAYVNTEKDEFFVKVTGAGMAGPDTVGPFWYGPIDMKAVSDTDVVKDKIDARSVMMQLGHSLSRSDAVHVTDVAKNDDGTFTASLAVTNWMNADDVRFTDKAIVDGDGAFVRSAVSSTDTVADNLDAWALASAVGLHTNRTYTPRVASVTKRDDGLFDVTLQAAHFMHPDDVSDTKRVVVDFAGEAQLSVAPSVTDATLAKLHSALINAKQDGANFAYNSMPLGVRSERVLLEKEPGFDTFTYTAVIPAGALYPGAPAQDPNEANHFWIERSGGFAGMTAYAGPFGLD